MRNKAAAVLITLIIVSCIPSAGQTREGERKKDVIAIVNGAEIKKADYGRWLFENANTFMLLENYLSTLLFKQEAKKLGLKVTEDDIERVLEEMVRDKLTRWKKSEKTYLKILKSREITEEKLIEELRDDNRREVISDLYASRIIYHNRDLSDEEVRRRFYNKHGRYGRKYRLRHIIKTIRSKYLKPEDAGYEYSLKKNDEIALANIKRIKKRLNDEGIENFSLIAENESEDRITSIFGGIIGIFNKNRYGGEFDKKVPELEAGELSDIIKSREGYHIVLVNSKKDGELDISHIMTKVSRNYVKDIEYWNSRKAELTEQFKKLKSRISKGADFELLAEDKSDDYSSIYGSDISDRWEGLYGVSFGDNFMNSRKGCLVIAESSKGIHLVLVEAVKVIELTGELRKEIVKDIQSGVADNKEIMDLAIILLRKSRTYYKL